jgi:hypothetical protein
MTNLGLDRLEQLRQGDRFQYRSVSWTVRDCSSYSDLRNYQITEWLIESSSGKKYYLLREVDPENSEQPVEWYLAEKLDNSQLYLPGLSESITGHLPSMMQEYRDPYPEIQANATTYKFESQTEGIYQNLDSKQVRITWDYWDSDRQWNLALETWEDGSLEVYLTQKVNPEEVYNLKRGVALAKKGAKAEFPIGEVIAAVSLLWAGILFMMLG